MKARDLLQALHPARIVTLPPSSWVALDGAPTGEIAVGIRCLSQQEIMTAKAEATKEAAARGGGGRGERYNEALLAWTVGFSVCDPNDASKPFFRLGDEDARRRLTPEALRRLWDETEMAHLETSPLRPEASDTDLAELALTLTDPGAWERLSPGDAVRLRRLLRFALEELAPPEEPKR